MKVRALVLAAALAAAGAAAFGLAGSAAATTPISSCTNTAGTIIAVDFSHWRGPVVRGCDTSSPSTGYTLLHDAGFTTQGDSHDGPAFICRIGNAAFSGGTQYPTPSQDPCVLTPPASAYWSYWLAPAGQNSWSYSQLGAMSEKPKAGEVELWIFGKTDIAGSQGSPTDGFPTCSPASLRAGGSGAHCSPVGKPTPPPSHSATKSSPHTTAPTSHSASTTKHASTPAGSSTTPRAGATSTAAGAQATSTAGSSPGVDGAAAAAGDPTDSGAAGPAIVDAQPAAKTKHSAGSAAPVVTTVAILAVLLAGAGYTRWRRTRLSTD